MIDAELLAILRCPTSGQRLRPDGDRLVSTDGSYSYDVVEGIPCLIRVEAESTHRGYEDLLAQNQKQHGHSFDLDGFINGMLVPTCGNLFRGVSLNGNYPIPDFPDHLPVGLTLDVGCNWGRWSIAGAMSGRKMVGVDIHLKSLMVARQLARKLVPGNEPHWVLADARYLPFSESVFDAASSYSVLQHFSRQNAAVILREISRVLKPGGAATIQMPNRDGLKARLTMGQNRFSDGTEFDVRYYSIADLVDMFERSIGKSRWDVDCYLGLNVHPKDRPLLRPLGKFVVDIAGLLYRFSRQMPRFDRLADSVWITAEKAE